MVKCSRSSGYSVSLGFKVYSGIVIHLAHGSGVGGVSRLSGGDCGLGVSDLVGVQGFIQVWGTSPGYSLGFRLGVEML